MPARAARSPKPDAGLSDLTRARLLEAAGEVFAERGFQLATVREICTRVNANVAAVNYHFRDKEGLYTEVLRQSVGAAENALPHNALSDARNPEHALRSFIHGMLQRMYGGGNADRALRIMAHEIAQPSAALASVIDEIIAPNYRRLRTILGSILKLPPEHDTTRLCAHSIIGQIVHYAHARPVIGILWPALSMTPSRIRQIADHITDFSLCSLRSLAKQKH